MVKIHKRKIKEIAYQLSYEFGLTVIAPVTRSCVLFSFYSHLFCSSSYSRRGNVRVIITLAHSPQYVTHSKSRAQVWVISVGSGK